MKMAKLLAAFAIVAAAAMLMTFDGGAVAHAASGGTAHVASWHDLITIAGPVVAATAVNVEGLRSLHADVMTRAAAKMNEIKDGMTDADVKRIEGEHDALLRHADTLNAAIEQAGAAAPARAAEVAAERERAAEIHRLAQRHGMDAGFAADHIGKGTAIEEVRTLVLDAVAKRSEQTNINNRSQIITDEGDTVRAAVESAIVLRTDVNAIKPDTEANRTLLAAARQWRGMKLIEMGRTYFEDVHGVKLRGLSTNELCDTLLGNKRAAGMQSTSDFPEILANVASKRLRDTYRAAVQTWRPFCRQNNAPDFKSRAIVQLTGMPELKKIREGEEYTFASLAESVERYSIATFGRKIAITRQTLVNDDLDAFSKVPALFGRAAAEFESDTVWGIITGNPVMGDNVTLFHEESHGNLSGAGADPSETTLEAADIAMGQQIDAAGKPLNLKPKFLAVSRKHKVKAMKLLTAVGATATGDVNVYANSMDLIIEDRLHKAGAGNISPWLVIADPAQWDTIEYAYLEGEEGLYTEQRQGFDVDGIEVKGRLDFGAKAIDYKGFYKNIGN